MTYRGHVKNGVIVLDEPLELPEGTVVQVATEKRARRSKSRSSLAMRHLGTIDDLPTDASERLEVYMNERDDL